MTSKDPVRQLMLRLARIEKAQHDKGSTPQLGTSSIEDGTLEINELGVFKGAVGKQVDGTNTVTAFNGPPPPAPTQPAIELLAGGVRVSWDGLWADGSLTPMDFLRIDVHFIDDPLDDPLEMPARASILSQGWGDAALPLIPGTYNAVLVAWTHSGQFTASEPSASFEVLSVVDGIFPITETDIADDAISTPKLQANSVIAEKLAAGSVQTDHLVAGSVTADKMEAQLVLATEFTTGLPGTDRLSLGPAGFFSDFNGERMFDLPAGGSPKIRGEAELERAVITDGIEIRGESSFEPNSSVRLASSLTSPGTAPIVTQSRESVALDYSGFIPTNAARTQPDYVSNPWWDASASLWRIATIWIALSGTHRVVGFHAFDADGVLSVADCQDADDLVFSSLAVPRGFFGLGGKWFLAAEQGASIYLLMYDPATGDNDSYQGMAPDDDNELTTAIGTDGTDIWFVKVSNGGLPDGFTGSAIPAGTLYAYRRPVTIVGTNFTLGAINKRVRLNQAVTGSGSASSRRLTSVSASRVLGDAAFDYAASPGNAYLNVTTSSNTSFAFGQTDASFLIPSGADVTATLRGAWYGLAGGHGFNTTDGYFWGLQQVVGRALERYAHNEASGQDYDFYYTWSDNNATGSRHESLLSPAYAPVLLPRNEITIQSAALPAGSLVPTSDDVDGVRFYVRNRLASVSVVKTYRVGSGNGHVAGTPGAPVQSAKIDTNLPGTADAPAYSVDTGLTRAPSSNSFASSGLLTPHRVYSESGGLEFDGAGGLKAPRLQIINFRVLQSLAKTLTTGTTPIKIDGFGNLQDGTGGSGKTDWTSYFTYASGDLTVLQDGVYELDFGIGIVGHATGTRYADIAVDGTAIVIVSGPAGTANTWRARLHDVVALTAGQVLSLNAFQNSGGDLTTVTGVSTQLRVTRRGVIGPLVP